MHVVLSIGGSSINPAGKPDVGFVKDMAGIITASKSSFGIVTGGGIVAREYAGAARALGAGEFDADAVAILATKQNAHMMVNALRGAAYPSVLSDFERARSLASQYKAVVMGGTIPGITTDTDAVLLAEAIGSKRLVNISNVDAIYDSDPRKNKGAKKLARLTYDQMNALATAGDQRKSGTNFIFDMLACKLIARSGIEAHFVSCKSAADIKNAIDGKPHGGTVVKG